MASRRSGSDRLHSSAALGTKLPRVRLHDLRHSAASLLIAEGVELVEVAVLLGHSELRATANLYSHLQKQTAATAARRWTQCLAGGRLGANENARSRTKRACSQGFWSRRWDSNPRPADYERPGGGAGADHRLHFARPAKPMPSRATVVGSGTGAGSSPARSTRPYTAWLPQSSSGSGK